MAPIDPDLISSVGDTALWMAAIRANETRRRDAVFRDPLAGILAGERGRRIARSLARPGMVHWGVVTRTSAIDRLILDAVEAGIDTVVNLGAGLDTRPYRMDLPATLRWFEIEFPGVLAGKTTLLAGHRPVCVLERVGADLLDREARSAWLSKVASGPARVLVLTEGVIPYLANEEVEQLAADLLAIPGIRLWIQDFDNGGSRPLPRGWAGKLGSAPFRFEVEDWFDFFRSARWLPQKVITTIEESERIGRAYPVDFPYGLLSRMLPKEMVRRIHSLSGVVVLERGQSYR